MSEVLWGLRSEAQDQRVYVHVARHTSHVTRHTSHVTRCTSHVTHHTSPAVYVLNAIVQHEPHLVKLPPFEHKSRSNLPRHQLLLQTTHICTISCCKQHTFDTTFEFVLFSLITSVVKSSSLHLLCKPLLQQKGQLLRYGGLDKAH